MRALLLTTTIALATDTFSVSTVGEVAEPNKVCGVDTSQVLNSESFNKFYEAYKAVAGDCKEVFVNSRQLDGSKTSLSCAADDKTFLLQVAPGQTLLFLESISGSFAGCDSVAVTAHANARDADKCAMTGDDAPVDVNLAIQSADETTIRFAKGGRQFSDPEGTVTFIKVAGTGDACKVSGKSTVTFANSEEDVSPDPTPAPDSDGVAASLAASTALVAAVVFSHI